MIEAPDVLRVLGIDATPAPRKPSPGDFTMAIPEGAVGLRFYDRDGKLIHEEVRP